MNIQINAKQNQNHTIITKSRPTDIELENSNSTQNTALLVGFNTIS